MNEEKLLQKARELDAKNQGKRSSGKVILIVLFILFGIGLLSSISKTTTNTSSTTDTTSPTPQNTQKWKTYTDTVSHYSISYPAEWSISVSPQSGQANEVNLGDYLSNSGAVISDTQDQISWINSWHLPTGGCGDAGKSVGSTSLCTYSKFTNKKGVFFDHYLVDGKGQFDEYGFNNGNVHLDIGFSHYLDSNIQLAVINSFNYLGSTNSATINTKP